MKTKKKQRNGRMKKNKEKTKEETQITKKKKIK